MKYLFQSGWLSDNEDPRLPYLTKLVSSVTNLSMVTAEDWQVGILKFII